MSISSRRFQRAQHQLFARYGAWVANASWPTDTEIARVAARRLSFAVFNYDSAPWAAKIKTQDPGIKLYTYICLASARSYEPTTAISGAVAYDTAVANGWLALDTAGQPISWPYDGHYQTAVWDTAYQDAYLARIRPVLENPLWDGIFADNDLWTLAYYSSALLAGTSSQAATDQKIRDGLDILVSKAGALAKSYGKIFMPNYGDGKLDTARQAGHAHYGGGALEEMFTAWPWSPPADLAAPIDPLAAPPQIYLGNSWAEQLSDIHPDTVNGAMTQIPTTDSRCVGLDAQVTLYGYTSFLLGAHPGDGWMPVPPTYDSSICPWYDFQSLDIGRPLGGYQVQGSVYMRAFERAFVAVNPTLAAQTVTLPDGTTKPLDNRSVLLHTT